MEPVNYQPPVQPPVQPPTQMPMQPPVQPVYAQSCLSAAWADIKATPSYVSRLLVLGLIMCVPILNFVVAGYFLLWSREVPFGGRTPLPRTMVSGKTFEFGFYAFVISLLAGIVGSVVTAVVGWVPLLGWIASIAVMIAVAVASSLMQMRMIMGLSIGDGFKLGDVWEKAKRNWGQLLLVTLVPSLIVGAVISVIAFVVVMVSMMLGFGASMPAMMAMSSMSEPSTAQVLSLMGTLAGPMLLGTLIVYLLASVVSVIADALTIRGLAHWVARYAPEWTALDMTPRY